MPLAAEIFLTLYTMHISGGGLGIVLPAVLMLGSAPTSSTSMQ